MDNIKLLSQQGRKGDGEVLLYSITFELFTESETDPVPYRILQQVSQNFIRKVWHEPDNAHLYLDQLDKIAQALSDHLHREVTVCDLIECNNPPHS